MPASESRTPAAVFEPGELVDNFRVLRLLGRGGMGEVYLAHDTKLGRKVALKAIHPSHLGSGQAAERFLFEARATARFSHPHIVTVYAVGEHRGMPYVALEYLPGRTLREQLDERTPSIREALRLGRAIAEALREAHHNKILHRDLKPENILIPRDGRLRVVDFGLAKKITVEDERAEVITPDPDPTPARTPTERGAGPGARHDDAAARLRETVPQVGRDRTDAIADTEAVQRTLPMPFSADAGPASADAGPASAENVATLTQGYTSGNEGIRGTPYYMAPEQWQGEATGEATDLWALGVILHELLAGKHPYPLQSRNEICAFVCGDEPIPSLSDDAIPPALARLVAACLSRAPAERPSSAEVIERFEELLHAGRWATGTERGPFRGLLPFSEEHAAVYFGRAAETDAFLEKIRLAPTIAVVGPSGAGKTSFVSAGVVPRLREQGAWVVLVLRPGHDPFRALAARLRGGDSMLRQTWRGRGDEGGLAADEQQLADELLEAPERLSLHLRQIAEQHQASVLLAVDQLEELYTLVDDPRVRRGFLQAICTAADDHQEPVRVIFTLRDDFLGRVAEGRAAQEALGRITVLRSPGRRSLTEILTRPLEVAGYRYDDDALVDEMIDSVGEEPACLPLLQFTARQLWERRDREGRLLKREAYEQIGGVAGALAAHADSVLEGLSPAQLRVARQLLLRLVTAEGTRRVITRRELLDGLGDGSGVVVERLTQSRLISVRRGHGEEEGEAQLELAHESLIQSWDRLAQWLEVSQDERAFLAEVGQAAELWRRRGRREQEVWQGEALEDALHALRRCTSPIPDEVRDFLAAGEKRRRRGRRLRWGVLAAVGVVLVTAVSLWVYTLTVERQAALSQRRRAERMSGDALRSAARLQLVSGQHPGARASLRSALELHDSRESRRLWLQLKHKPLLWSHKFLYQVVQIAVSPDGRLAAVTSKNAAVTLLDLRTWRRRSLASAKDRAALLLFSPDSKTLITASQDNVIKRWDLASGRGVQVGKHRGKANAVRALALHPNGSRLYSSTFDNITRWDLTGRSPPVTRAPLKHIWGLRVLGQPPRLRMVSGWQAVQVADGFEQPRRRTLTNQRGAVLFPMAIDPRGLLVAATSMQDRVVSLVEIGRDGADPITRQLLPVEHTVTVVNFSADGRSLLVATRRGEVDIWDVTTGVKRQTIKSVNAWISTAVFTTDGRGVLVGDRGGNLRLWRVDPEVAHLATGHRGGVTGVRFRPDGKALVSVGLDGQVIFWDRLARRRVAHEVGKPLLALAFSPDSRRMATVGADAIVRLWNAQTGNVLHELRGHRGQIEAVAFSPDSRLLATGGRDATIRLWRVHRPEQVRSIAFGGRVSTVSFHPQGELLVAAGVPDVKVFEVATGKERRRLKGAPVHYATYSPKGLLAFKDATTTIRFDPSTSSVSEGVSLARRIISGFTGVPPTFDPSGAKLAIQSREGSCIACQAVVVDLTGRALVRIPGHHAQISASAFSPCGKRLATADRMGSVRLWTLPTGRPVVHAPLMLSTPPRLVTNRGTIPLGALDQAPSNRWREGWLRAVRDRARAADLEPQSGTLCLLGYRGSLERWDTRRDRRGYVGKIGVADQVVALSSSCAVRLDKGRVSLQVGSAAPRVLPGPGSYAIARQGRRLLVTANRQLSTFDVRGKLLRRRPLQEHVARALPTDEFLVAGFNNGHLVRARLDGSDRPRHFADAATSSPTALIAGPNRTVVAGHFRGTVAIWDLDSLKLIHSFRLNGKVEHLLHEGGKLHAATDAGDHRSVDLSALGCGYCALLRRVWEVVPTVWRGGELVPHPHDPGHRCALKRER